MIPLLPLLAAALAGPVERIDLLSAGPEGWLWDEAPLAGQRPATAALRLGEQVSIGFRLPVDGLAIGTSWRTQELRYGRDFGDTRAGWVVGLPTRLLMPRGLRGGLRLRLGDLHLEAGAVLDTGSTWARPAPGPVRVSPTLGIGMWLGGRDIGASGR